MMAVMTESVDPTVYAVGTDRVRLHISPLNPTTITKILPPSVLPLASDISYHSIQTFPERDYGFVELPSDEASKLRKKLNGLILRGQKMKLEEARPKGEKHDSKGNEEPEETTKQSTIKNKRKRTEGILPGVQLPEGRKVERGWTKPKSDEKTKTKSKKGLRSEASAFTDGPECLFKANPPKNALKIKSSGKKSKSKDNDKTVHEFTNTTKYPSFLRSGAKPDATKVTAEYQDGVGWVNGQGEVVEKSDTRKSRRDSNRAKTSDKCIAPDRKAVELNEPDNTEQLVDDDYTSSSGSSDSEDEDSDDKAAKSDDNEDSIMEDDTPKNQKALKVNIPDFVEKEGAMSKSNKKSPKLFIQTKPAEPHPFETLFKRPSISENKSSQEPSRGLDAQTSFNFFGGATEDGDIAESHPMTPHSQLELRERTWRSAAPTPDTAAIGKYFPKFAEGSGSGSGSSQDDEVMEDQFSSQHTDEPIEKRRSLRTSLGVGEFDGKAFEKSFYERRGDTNRAWKQRRRETSKQKRKLENKKRPTAT